MSSVTSVEALLKELGIEDRVKRVAENVWAIAKGSVLVQIVAAPEFVISTAKIAQHQPSANAEALFRTLLTAQAQLLGAFFTLESDGSIRVNQILPADWLQSRELAFIVGNVGELADAWTGKLAAMMPETPNS
jgi:hypothetical protein